MSFSFSRNSSASITLKPIIYLVQSWDRCYRCKDITSVFCLAADGLVDHETGSNFNGFFRFHEVTYIEDDLKEILKERCPSYYLDYTKMSNSSYFVNHCKCGAKLGDFYLHNEPGSPFWPQSEADAEENIFIQDISYAEAKISGNYTADDTDFILKHAIHVED